MQRVAIVLSLGLPADIYLIDEPSAYLDSEQRITAAKIIKRFILSSRRTALIIEHDFIMATYLADKVIVYDGQPGIHAFARKWVKLRSEIAQIPLLIILRFLGLKDWFPVSTSS